MPTSPNARPEPPPPAGLVIRRRGDWGAFRAAEPGTDDVFLLRPTGAGLRIERPAGFETVPWDDVAGVALTQVRLGPVSVPVARVLFASGPSLDLADVLAPGADELPMSLEAGGPPLYRVERFRMVVACIVASSGLSPRSRERFHRGGRGVPEPELTPRPRRTPRWLRPALAVASVVVLALLFPDVGFAGSLAIHAALFVHEGGHAVAMRLVRADVRSILFIPAFGAATVPEHPYRSRWDDVRVALAGPGTGVPLAAVTLLLCTGPPPRAVQWGLLAGVVYNLLNLLPLLPMDGGRVLVAVVAGLPSAVRTALVWTPPVAAAGMLVLLGGGTATLGGILLLVLTFLATPQALRRLGFDDWALALPAGTSALRVALRDVAWGTSGIARDDLDGGVPPAPMGFGRILVALGLYGFLVVVLGICTVTVWPLVPGVRGE